MSASALASIIDRVSNTKRRLGEQRADFKKQDMLVKMVEQIIKSQQRSLENQRTTMSDSRKDAIEMGKIGEKIEKQAARRMGNQDWVTKEERFRQEFVELFKLMSEPKRLDNQRVEMNEDGIKEAGIRSICSKIGRMEERRLGNQEATFSASKSNQPRSSGTPKTVI